MADEMVWMRHESGGVPAKLPVAAREAWEAKGWAECEAPAEQDPAMAEHVPLAVAVAAEASSDDEEFPTSTESEEE